MERFCILLATLALAALALTGTVRAGELQRDSAHLLAAWDKTGLDLYGQLREEPGNLVISPYSIGTAMSMVRSAASGQTDRETARVLHHPFDSARVETAYRGHVSWLDDLRAPDGITLANANALALTQHGGTVTGSYRKLLQEVYGAEIFGAHGVGPINHWVKDKTRGGIDRILEKLSGNSVCVLLNAVYFKGNWSNQFDKAGTASLPFHVEKADPANVPTMRRTGTYRTLHTEDYQAIALPYAGDDMAMLVLMPPSRDVGLSELERKLSRDLLDKARRDLFRGRGNRTSLQLPRFGFRAGASLISPFQKLGMKLAFDPTAAEFAGLLGPGARPGLVWIAQIVHKARIEVNEEGSEASAATAVEIATRSAPHRTQRFHVDRPFLFAIMAKDSGSLFFLGRVTDPRKE